MFNQSGLWLALIFFILTGLGGGIAEVWSFFFDYFSVGHVIFMFHSHSHRHREFDLGLYDEKKETL